MVVKSAKRTLIETVRPTSDADRSLEVRRLDGEGYTTTSLLRNDDRVTAEQFPGLEFPLTALWEDLGD